MLENHVSPEMEANAKNMNIYFYIIMKKRIK